MPPTVPISLPDRLRNIARHLESGTFLNVAATAAQLREAADEVARLQAAAVAEEDRRG